MNEQLVGLIRASIADLYDEMIKIRRHLHQYPEPSFKEFKTSEYIAQYIEGLGLTPKRYNPTGVSCDLVGTLPSAGTEHCIALRADIDALEVQESSGVEFSSKHAGFMHACGHDTHMAMLMTAMKALSLHKDKFAGRIRFIFQPAEELTRGAKMMIEQGVMEGVEACYGSHIYATLAYGALDIQAGPRYAASDICDIEFTGRQTHGAQPHMGVDTVLMLAHFVSQIQSIVSRRVDPQHPAVVTVGSMHAGTRFNVIPGEARCSMTIRSFYPEDRKLIRSCIESYAHHIAEMEGGRADISYTYGGEVVVNDQEFTMSVARLAASLYGESCLISNPATLAGEDFGEYSKYAPSCFVNLGAAFEQGDKNYPLHSDHFLPDERALVRGAEMYALVAYDFLDRKQRESEL